MGCLVVFVTKIDILATKSSEINYDLCSIENNNAFSVKYSNLTKLARPTQNQIISEYDLPIY